MAWLPLRLPPHCKFVVSITCEEGKPETLENLRSLRSLVESEDHFLLVSALGKDLAWTVMKLWMKNAGRDLNNFQWRVVANGMGISHLLKKWQICHHWYNSKTVLIGQW
jgi:hypothetical protein